MTSYCFACFGEDWGFKLGMSKVHPVSLNGRPKGQKHAELEFRIYAPEGVRRFCGLKFV